MEKDEFAKVATEIECKVGKKLLNVVLEYVGKLHPVATSSVLIKIACNNLAAVYMSERLSRNEEIDKREFERDLRDILSGCAMSVMNEYENLLACAQKAASEVMDND